MLQQYKIDEFGIILIGSLIFFLGLTAINYLINPPAINITKNVTNQTILISKTFILDGIEKKITLLSAEEKIYKSLFDEKKFIANLEIPKEDLSEISRLEIEFNSEKDISKLYLIEGKNLIPAKKYYLPNEIKQKMLFVAKIEEFDMSLHLLILSILISVSLIIFLAYREYPMLRPKIKITGSAIILTILVIFISYSYIRQIDTIKLNIYGIKEKASKTFQFNAIPKIYNVTITFEIGKSQRTGELKIYLNNELIYNNIPQTYFVRIPLTNTQLKQTNFITLEARNAIYEINNLYIKLS